MTTAGGSNINSNDMLAAIYYPNTSTGNPDSSHPEGYTENALGQTLTMADRNGNVHTYSYDVLGRPTADAVTTLGSGVDGSVRIADDRLRHGGQALPVQQLQCHQWRQHREPS